MMCRNQVRDTWCAFLGDVVANEDVDADALHRLRSMGALSALAISTRMALRTSWPGILVDDDVDGAVDQGRRVVVGQFMGDAAPPRLARPHASSAATMPRVPAAHIVDADQVRMLGEELRRQLLQLSASRRGLRAPASSLKVRDIHAPSPARSRTGARCGRGATASRRSGPPCPCAREEAAHQASPRCARRRNCRCRR